MKIIKDNILYTVVFITGAVILSVEILAFRILSPFFGNTIYSTSSIIGVVLGALSLGYYFGGKFSDKRPSPQLLYLIISFGGLSCMLIPAISETMLLNISLNYDVRAGSVIASTVLFFIPSFLLGTVSPFVIKLQSLKAGKELIGTVSGKVFFFSTLGSIFGTLLTGFYIVPNFGIFESIAVASLILVFVGVLGISAVQGFNPRTKHKQKYVVLILIIFSVLFVAGKEVNSYHGENVMYADDGLYERIRVFDTVYKDRPVRMLLLDKSPASAIYLDSDELVYDYSKFIDLFVPDENRKIDVLIIGAGAYSIPKELVRRFNNIEVDVLDIEPKLYDISVEYFGLVPDPRIKSYFEDGRSFLLKSDKKYDLVLSDAYYSYYSIPTHLTTQEYFQNINEVLKDNGMFMANVIGRITQDTNFLLSEFKTVRSVFENTYMIDTSPIGNTRLQNFVFVSYKDPEKVISGLPDGIYGEVIEITDMELKNQVILTDNFAPVEYMLQKDYPGD